MRRTAVVGVLVSACIVGILTGCTAWFGPSIDFEASTVEGPAPLIVEFTPVSDETVGSCAWTFGDSETSDRITPVHIYRAPGTYTVTLTVQFVDGTVATTEKADLVMASAPRF